MSARVVHTVVFADGEHGGNPCPVVFDADDLDTAQMQALAAGFGHETAFILAPREGGDVRLRYFVPRHEMEMCVHATVACALLTGATAVETPLGTRAVALAGDRAMVEQFPPRFAPPLDDPAELLHALGIRELAGAAQSVSTARPKLLVPLEDEAALDALAPDFPTLWDVCRRLGVTGAYPYCTRAREADVAARQFPVEAGYDEDPATGVAACALGARLASGAGWSRFTIAQGRAMGRPSLITAEAFRGEDGELTATRVGGTARRADR
jgi:trans-2,3-dihydro-3-hydroxyanthranilate isomerase